MATHKHKYKIGDSVNVQEANGIVSGTIHSYGYAINGTNKFMTTDGKHDIEDKHPLGYQVMFYRKVKIIKECDILPV
jgi:hypothetical protein